jgi:hypothetical protein
VASHKPIWRFTATNAAARMIALLFQPLRRRAQLFANRLVYGERVTPYQALPDFAGAMAGQLGLAEAVDLMVSVPGWLSAAAKPLTAGRPARSACCEFQARLAVLAPAPIACPPAFGSGDQRRISARYD